MEPAPSRLSSPNSSSIAQIGNYNLVKTIGKGQFGSVKLAVHSLTGEKVAIKIISKNRLDEKTLRMVYREVSIMKLLNHPNIIRLYEVIETPTHLFLVMEYASGGEVMDFIVAHGKLKEKDARRFFRQVVAAIDYCHSVHVIHRDLKAENLLLDEKFHIRLIDFGLSNRWSPGEYLNTFCGSPTYTAPELIKRQKYEGPEVDVWSMGVLLYVLVCGSLPFDGSSFQELFTKIIAGDYTIPSDVSPECRDLIGRMLVVDPKQRATVDQIRTHKWILEDGKPVPKAVSGVSMPTSIEDLDMDLIDEMQNFGFERDATIHSLLDNSYDDAAATYYLLYAKKHKHDEVPAPRPSQKNKQPASSAQGQRSHVVKFEAGGSQKVEATQAAPKPTSTPNKANLRHRRHHTVGTPGEFNIDEPDSAAAQPPRTTLSPISESSAHTKSKRRASPQKEPSPPRQHHVVVKDAKDVSHKSSSAHKADSERQKQGSRTPDTATEKLRASASADEPSSQGSHSAPPKSKRPTAKNPVVRQKAATMRVGKEAKRQKEKMVELDEWNDEFSDAPTSPTRPLLSDKRHKGEASAAALAPTPSPPSFIDSVKSKIGGLLQFKKPEPRQARFPLNEQSTSHKPPDQILEQIKKVLSDMDIPFLSTAPFCLKCQTPSIGFEVEICRLPFLYLNGVRFRRIYGDAWVYTSTCKKILAKLDLKNEKF